ncbi:hypothetical protein GLOIN_2v1840190 [Rhizophagus clarus]|uniref:Uncharacterized protein n=2 Tax=Rhizophagus clarus TaxID=94130 RepID=A0A8H3KTZ5_9GLOM|nr:hypothetical protein GLOIN_2v1840190 [Rhizophagus clarus]
MSKSKEYVTILIFAGKIVENLHFNPFCYNWWLAQSINKNPTHIPLLLIRVYSSPTEAINTCYEKVFHSNAKFSGPQVMGFDNSDIIQQLLDNIIFCLYMISFRKLNVIMLGMGKLKKPEWNYTGEEYKSIFQSYYDNTKSAFIQEVEDEECVVQIYTNNTLIRTYNAIDPDEVWLCIGRLSNYSRKKLFGLENLYTQICIQQAQIPSCMVSD